MKKKHEIIKYAYENFPKGTLFRWYKGVAPFVSTGKFKFEFSDNNALFVDLTDDSTDAGVTVFDGEKWAKIVPEKKSILDGKVAIQVNNEREFKLLMEHYESKGWKWRDQSKDKTVVTDDHFDPDIDRNIIQYNDKCVWMHRINSDEYNCEKSGYTIISFIDLADEVGLKVPVFNVGDHVYIKSTDAGCNLVEGRKGIIVSNDTIANRGMLEAEDYDYKIAIDGEVWRVKGEFEPAKFVMRSEDGVDLYEGDNYHRAYAYENGVWIYDFCEKLALNHVVCNPAISSLAKAFSTKEAAEKWIDEQNKPKSVQVPLFNTNMAMVSKDKIDIIDVIGASISLKPSDIEDMLHAYKSLQ